MKQLQSRFTEQLEDIYIQYEKTLPNMLTYFVEKEDLINAIKRIKDNDARFITMVGSDERHRDEKFGLYYVFALDDAQALITIHTRIHKSDPTYPSATSVLKNCNWYEREVHDLLGIVPEKHPQLIPLMLHKDWPKDTYPLRKDYSLTQMQQPETSQDWFTTTYEGEGVTKVPVGPIHAGIIEPGHFSFGIAGDAILHLDAQLFFKHRGVEKRSEGMSIEEGLLLAERICGMCSVSHDVSYSLAI